MGDLDFRVMAFAFKFRDLVIPRERVLGEIGVEPGAVVLDYGCGAGSYVGPLARVIGPTGHIYAVDINPLALKATEKVMARNNLDNVTTILSDRNTGLPKASVDVILLYDILHHLVKPEDILRELHRVLRPNGLLSCTDHHLDNSNLVASVTGSGLFKLVRQGRKTHSFAPSVRS